MFLFLRISFFLFFLPRILSAQDNGGCTVCHGDKSLSTEKKGRTVSLFVNGTEFENSAHGNIDCVGCHEGFRPDDIPHKAEIHPVNCNACHEYAIPKHTFHPQMTSGPAEGKTPDISCAECHGTHGVSAARSYITKSGQTDRGFLCGRCHDDIEKTFGGSNHGEALRGDVKGAPDCLSCHRSEITGGSGKQGSGRYKLVQEKVCLSCHIDNSDVRERVSPSAGFIAAYENSVHGSALLKGNLTAANCVDCHGSHDMRKGTEPTAKTNRMHIPETCSKCHLDVAKEYDGSIHGIATKKGVRDSPICTDCHGEHNILSADNPDSPVSSGNVSDQVCSPCHGSVKLSEKYGLASNRFKTFSDSYHGLATRSGSVEVANCASCHGVHNIKPSSDSSSTISKGNLVATCGKCHPGANNRFTIGAVHVSAESGSEPLLYWIVTLYTILIAVTIGLMVIHNSLDFIRKSNRKLKVRRGLIREESGGMNLYPRMSKNERIQHVALFISFFILVVTGFALRYPDAWWVRPVQSISPVIFEVRGIVHRIAAVILTLTCLYHIYYIAVIPRGKQLVRDLLPVKKDFSDFIGMLKYNWGITPAKPKFGRFSYIEKSEYWALVWGSVVMGLTGFILWFDNTFMGMLTKLGWDAARLIHFYEAWLATLAIIVWHFFFVIFNPDIYPMNLAWIKGTLSETEMLEDHPLELEAIKKSETGRESGNTEPTVKSGPEK